MGKRISYEFYLFPVVVALVFMLSSCFKDEIDLKKISTQFELTPGIAMPIGYGQLTINDMLERFDSTGFIKEDSVTGFLKIIYDAHLLSYEASEIIKVPNQKFDQFFARSEIALPQITDSIQLSKKKNYGFKLNPGEQIDSINLNKGILRYNISSSFLNTGILEVSSENLLKNGKPYLERIPVGNTSGNFSTVVDYDLTRASLHLSRSNDSSFVPLSFKLTLYDSQQPLRVGDSILVDISFLNLDFHIIYGDFGYKSFLNHQGDIELSLFKAPLGGEIEFANPTFDILIRNSFGIPIQVKLSEVSSSSDRTNQNEDITFPPSDNPFDIHYPLLEDIGSVSETNFTFDNIDPSFSAVMKTEPNKIHFIADAYTDTTKTSHQNFIIDTSKFVADLNVTLPMELRAGNFELESKMEFNLKDMLGKASILDSLDLKLDVKNGLPLDFGIQLTFLDSNENVLDILYDPMDLPQVQSGILDSEFMVNQLTGKTTRSTYARLGQDKIKKIENTRFVKISATLTTTEFNTNQALKVKFFSDYRMDFDLAVKVRFRLNNENLSQDN
jgi:hypothetical protein